MIYILAIVTVAALAVLYNFLPNKRFFVGFCAVLIIIFCVSSIISGRRNHEEQLTREQIETIQQQEKIFADWYAEYQKDIDTLDRNWQLYHSIIENLKTAEIYEYSTYEQLEELEQNTIEEQIKIHQLQPPTELDDETKNILNEVIHKTQIYADAQTKTISMAKDSATPEKVPDIEFLNRRLNDITIRESPAGLFVATEISAIREKFVLPEEEDFK